MGYTVIADDDPRIMVYLQQAKSMSSEAIVKQSYAASLQRKGAALQVKGNYAGATALYLKAAGVQT